MPKSQNNDIITYFDHPYRREKKNYSSLFSSLDDKQIFWERKI